MYIVILFILTLVIPVTLVSIVIPVILVIPVLLVILLTLVTEERGGGGYSRFQVTGMIEWG